MAIPDRARSAADDGTGGWPARSFLGALPAAHRPELLDLGTPRRFERDTPLMLVGEPGAEAFLITEGCVKVTGGSVEGYPVLLAIRMAGDLVGELAVLDGEPRSATVLAAAPTVARAIPAATLRRYLAEHPAVDSVLRNSVNAKFRQATRHRSEANGAPAPLRLARVLHRLAETYGEQRPGGVAIPVPLSQADLAALIGASEQSIRRTLADLRAQGIVKTSYRTMVIADLDGLQAWITQLNT